MRGREKMDFSNWNPDLVPGLMAAVELLEVNSSRELAIRIVSALQVQDSCEKCWIETMRQELITGKPGLYTCEECTEEIIRSSTKPKENENNNAQR